MESENIIDMKKNNDNALLTLIDDLEAGQLTASAQQKLAELLKNSSPSLIMTATHHQRFSGPIPPPEQLKNYPEDARQLILQMAKTEQQHAHLMNEKALNGAISKDRLGQFIGGMIAVVGLGVAGWIAQYSTTAAAIIGSLDLFGMVALFVAPRLLENHQTKIENES